MTRGQTKPKSTQPQALDVYLDAAGKHPRLSAEDERSVLAVVVRLRERRHEAIIAALGELGLDADELGKTCDDTIVAQIAPRLDPDTAQALRTLDRRYKRRRNEFLCANLRFVVSMASRYANHWMSLNDRVQEGNLGLLKAIERFDPSHGTRFSTYAAWWIRHHITRALVNRGRKIRIPAHLHRLFMKARTRRSQLRSELGRDPTTQELATALDVSPARLKDACEAMELRAVSLDSPADGTDARSFIDTLATTEDEDMDRILDKERNWEGVVHELPKLDERAQEILRHRFGLDESELFTLRTLGERYTLSRERIRQLQNRALSTIRDALEHRHHARS